MIDPDPPVVLRATPGRNVVREVLRRPAVIVGATIILVAVIIAVIGPFLAPFDPNYTRLEEVNGPPFAGDFLLGGDRAGRDILSRLLVAAGGTMGGALIAVLVSTTIGVTAGLVAGYYAGWFDSLSSWLANVLLAVPGIIVLIAVYVVVGPTVVVSMAVVGLLFAPDYFRLVRNTVIAVKHELFVDAARVAGLSDARIIARHIVSAVRAPIIVEIAFVAGLSIIIQAGLEFLGLGTPESPTWGGMLQDSFSALYVAPWAIVWPALAITLTVLSFVLVANGVRDTLAETSNTTSARHSGRTRPTESGPLETGDILRASGLGVAYPDGAGSRSTVSGVDLTLRRGEVLGLVGESGSGKTQTALAILGLLPRTAMVTGSVRLGDIELLGLSGRAFNALRGTRIAYVPQEPMSNLDPSFTVAQQFGFAMRGKVASSRAEIRARALELLERVEVPEPRRVLDLYPHQLSGGMAQRVLIAIAVACDPEVLIADEPTTALDVTVQAEALELLRGLQRERGMSIILVTHDLGVVADICDRVSVMTEGRVVETAPVDTLFSSPKHPYTQRLLATANEVPEVRVYVEPAVSR